MAPTNTTDEKRRGASRLRTQQPESRPITAASYFRRGLKNMKYQRNKSQVDRDPAAAITFTDTSTTSKQLPSIVHHDARSGSSSQPTAESPLSEWDLDPVKSYGEAIAFDEGGEAILEGPTLAAAFKQARPTSYPHCSKHPQDLPSGGAESTVLTGGSPTSQAPVWRRQSAQLLRGHLPEDDQWEMLEIGQPVQGSNNGKGIMGAITSSVLSAAGPPPSKNKYELLKDELTRAKRVLDGHKQDLQKARGELRNAHDRINEIYQEQQRMKDHMGGLQNELNNVNHRLEDAKNLSDVRAKELFGSQGLLTRADTLSISEVGEKVTVLNREIFQAAVTLGAALIHQPYEVPQADLDAAAEESQELVGKKISSILISQTRKTPEINPLLARVVFQIFIVKFCIAKIRSWYLSDSNIGEFLGQLYTDIRLKEAQAVSGRWRALTRAHTRPTTETWTNELSQKLLSVLKIASWNIGSPETLVHHITPIFKAVIELRDALGEKITSADLDISAFDCDMMFTPFYKGGKRVDEMEAIVGTTGIGLRKFMAERGANNTFPFENVIEADIVLESSLKEALESMQSSTRKLNGEDLKESVENAGGCDQDGRDES